MLLKKLLCHLVCIFFFYSCSTSKNPLFKKSSPHDAYGNALNETGLSKTQLGTAWFNAAARSLQQPAPISLPFKETGYFAADKPAANGYVFNVRRGDRIIVNVNTLPASGFKIFTEIWQPAEVNVKQALLTATDTLSKILQINVKKDGRYIIRLQPELLQGVEYTITITTAPSLAFPVDKSGNPKLISLWGVPRDGGARLHEGVDISAKHRTPALASADGYISRVSENEIGGKVVFLTDDDFGYNIYYAHLDEQLVKAGQKIKAGEQIGLVGNTGNAKNTIPHLHYGIYTNDGAIDPLAFIDTKRPEPKSISIAIQNINRWLRTTSNVNITEGPSSTSQALGKSSIGDAVFIESASDKFYKVLLPGGVKGYIPGNVITGTSLGKITAKTDTRLLDTPGMEAASKTMIPKGTVLDIIGNYFEFALVSYKEQQGWVTRKL